MDLTFALNSSFWNPNNFLSYLFYYFTVLSLLSLRILVLFKDRAKHLNPSKQGDNFAQIAPSISVWMAASFVFVKCLEPFCLCVFKAQSGSLASQVDVTKTQSVPNLRIWFSCPKYTFDSSYIFTTTGIDCFGSW